MRDFEEDQRKKKEERESQPASALEESERRAQEEGKRENPEKIASSQILHRHTFTMKYKQCNTSCFHIQVVDIIAIMKNNIIDDQIEYYRARAGEYDETTASFTDAFTPAKTMLKELGRFDHILELACGTGFWTESLLQMGRTVTALDAAPEMLEIARKRLGEDHTTYQQADLFRWKPTQEYDLVFFANWLSHVPPESLDDFLSKVRRSVRADGHVAIVDQYAPSNDDKSVAKDEIYAARPLADGRTFTIVKIFCDLNDLKKKLESLGFEIEINQFTDTFFFLSGKRIR